MTGDDRLRADLEALEHAAPGDLPPRPATQVRSSRIRLWAPAAVMVAAGLMIGITLPSWLDRLGPPGSVSPDAAASRAPTTGVPAASASPPQAVGLEWHAVPFPEPGAILVSIAYVEGRLILTGSLDGQPQAWNSDDGGTTWELSRRSSIDDLGPIPPEQMGLVAGTRERLVSLGTRLVGANDGDVETVVWTSDDFGRHWIPIAYDAVPVGADHLLWTGSLFMAFDGGAAAGVIDLTSSQVTVWTSADGSTWDQATRVGQFGTDVGLLGVAAFDGRAAMLLADREAVGRIWYSDDGSAWTPSAVRAADALSAGPNGFVAVERDAEGDANRMILRSTDAATWTGQAVHLEMPGGVIWAQLSAISEGDFGAVIGGFTGPFRGASGSHGWFLPTGAGTARLLATPLSAVAVGSDGSIYGIAQCPPRADCFGPSVVSGLPLGTVPPASPRPVGDLVGALDGDADFEGGCAWITDSAGESWEVIWPDGYEIQFAESGAVLLGPADEVVAKQGDVVTLDGSRPTGLGSRCQSGTLFEATRIISVD